MTADNRTDAPAMLASGSILAAILFLLLAAYSSFTIIQPGNVGVVFNRWSGALKTVGQGVAWRVPWITQVQSYPIALRTYTMVERSVEGSVRGDDSLDLPTKEGQHIRQDISVTYNTSQEKAADVFRSFRGAEIGDIESTFIRRTIITTAQNAAGQMSLTDLISNQRGQLQGHIQEDLQVQMNKMGFVVDKVNLGASHLPDVIEKQMQQKMGAQQNAQQAEYELQRQQTLAKAKIAEAEGDAQAGDSRQGQGGGRGEQAPAGGAHAAAHPEQGDRALERHAAAVHRRRSGSLPQPEGPGWREWRGPFYCPRALRY